MNYIGSKANLIPFIETTINEVVGEDWSQKIFCDLFAGSGAIGKAFKHKAKWVISNDIEYFSYILNYHYMCNTLSLESQRVCETLNTLVPREGFIYQHYCLGSGSGRAYFSDANGQKIDAIRHAMVAYQSNDELFTFLLASLLESADKVANTASVYSAFLKRLKPLAQRSFALEPSLCVPDLKSHKVYQSDANTLISKIEGDILYLDPPYNRRQYGANYHLLNTIAQYDTFEPKGKTGVRKYQSSSYCKTTTALSAFEALIQTAQFPYIFVSYNDEGLLTQEQIQKIMQKYGKYSLKMNLHHRYKAYDNRLQKHHTIEYLHILEKI